MPKREKTILIDLAVGITPEIDAALTLVSDAWGIRPSQYARQAIIQRLVTEGFMQHPMAAKMQKPAAPQAAAAPQVK